MGIFFLVFSGSCAKKQACCWTYSHRCQIPDKNPSKTWNGEFGGFVYVLDGFPQRDFVLWVFMCPINISLLCVYFVSLLSLLSFPATTPRATTPHLYRPGYHAFTTTARLPRLSLSRLPRHSSLFYSWVITPELSLSTTHVHRVITPAIVSSL